MRSTNFIGFLTYTVILTVLKPLDWFCKYKTLKKLGNNQLSKYFSLKKIKLSQKFLSVLILIAWVYLTFLLVETRLSWYGRACSGDFIKKKNQGEEPNDY